MNTQSTSNYPDASGSDASTTELYTQSYGSSDTSTSSGSGQLADKAGQVAGQAKDAVGDTVGKVRDQAISQMDAQKGRATDALSNVAQAVRTTGNNLREQGQAPIAQYADTAADQIERLSTYLNNRDIGQMATELQHFARTQSAIFLGGAFMAGLLVARFLKSSNPDAQNYGGQGAAGYSSRGSYSAYGGYGGYGSQGYSGYSGSSSYGNRSGYGSDMAGYDSGIAGQGDGIGAGTAIGYSGEDDSSSYGPSAAGSADATGSTSSDYGSTGAGSDMEAR